MLEKFRDWKRQWTQILFLFLVFIIAWFYGEKLINFMESTQLKQLYELGKSFHFGGWWTGILAIVAFNFRIRSCNKDFILNNGNIYHEHCYYGYCLCSWILGYKKCNMRLVPIPLQVKLILNDIFEEYICSEGIHDSPKSEKAPQIKLENDSCFTRYVNLVLIDTYEIYKEQLPPEVQNLTTICIRRYRSKNDNTRYSSEKFVKAVLNEVRHLPKTTTDLNVFATLNPVNCYNITKEVFSTGGRDSIRHLYVYRQEKNPPGYFYGKVKIY